MICALTVISNSSAKLINLDFASKFCLLIAIGTVILMQSQGWRNKDYDSSSGLCKTSCILIIYSSIHLTSFHY